MCSLLTRRPNRFLERRKSRRIAAFITSTFPLVDQEFAYAYLQRQAMALDADYRIFYEEPTPLGQLPAPAKAWLSQGFVAPPNSMQEDADIDHFRRACPARLDAALADIAAALGCPTAAVLERPEVRSGIAQARLAQAWAADLVTSFFAYECSLKAYLTCALLELPRLLYLGEIDDLGWMANLLPLHVRQAEWVVLPTQARIDEVCRRFGEGLRPKLCTPDGNPDWEIQTTRHAAVCLRQRPAAVTRRDLGPEAAFRTQRMPAEAQGTVTPFVILGAERTGSNLVTDMLLTHPHVTAAGEIFNTRMIDDGVFDMRAPVDVDLAELIELRRRDPGACHRRLLQIAEQRGAKAAGFKLMYYHGLVENRIIDHLLAMPDLRIVHLVREDRLARWISLARARRSDAWWTASDAPKPKRHDPIDLDINETLLTLEATELQEERYRATFNDCQMLEVSYEQLSTDLERTSAHLLDFLGVEPMPLLVQSQKTGEENPRRSIGNWQQLVDAFTDTRWQDEFLRA